MRKTKLVLESGRSNVNLSVRVVDPESRTLIASFTLNPQDFWDMSGGAYIEIGGELTEHFDRVGKTMVTDSVVYTAKDLSASTYDQMEADAEQLARADRPGWEMYAARRTNSGRVHVTLRRWEAQS